MVGVVRRMLPAKMKAMTNEVNITILRKMIFQQGHVIVFIGIKGENVIPYVTYVLQCVMTKCGLLELQVSQLRIRWPS